MSSSQMQLLNLDEIHGSGMMIIRSPAINDCDLTADQLFEEGTCFTLKVQTVSDEVADTWLMRVDQHIASLCGSGSSLIEELVATASLADSSLVLSQETGSMLRLFKTKDNYFKRSELLDPDKDLKSFQLAIKNKVMQLY